MSTWVSIFWHSLSFLKKKLLLKIKDILCFLESLLIFKSTWGEMPRACGEGGTVRRSGRGIQAKALPSSWNIVCCEGCLRRDQGPWTTSPARTWTEGQWKGATSRWLFGSDKLADSYSRHLHREERFHADQVLILGRAWTLWKAAHQGTPSPWSWSTGSQGRARLWTSQVFLGGGQVVEVSGCLASHRPWSGLGQSSFSFSCSK